MPVEIGDEGEGIFEVPLDEVEAEVEGGEPFLTFCSDKIPPNPVKT